jgi:hypothetical protein
VLAELARFDPALEAHPQIDRYLLSKPAADATKTAPHYPRLALESARRRAFFEWTRSDLQHVAADPEALDVARGQHRAFRNLPLEADPQARAKICERLCAGISRLEVFLVYRYRSGAEERLRLGADLFHLLLELADGYQLGDVSTDDTFAHLSIFVQRLAREDERELLAWNPMRDETLYRISAVTAQGADEPQQRLVISPLARGAET